MAEAICSQRDRFIAPTANAFGFLSSHNYSYHINMRGKKVSSLDKQSTITPPKKSKKLNHPPARSMNDSSETGQGQALPIELKIIDVIKDSLKDTISQPDLHDNIQKIKGLLYDRRFLEVFEVSTSKIVKYH